MTVSDEVRGYSTIHRVVERTKCDHHEDQQKVDEPILELEDYERG